jgi:serine phosphatase RsbU (regulator of sigma subunit)
VRRGDVILSINGVPASDLKKMTSVNAAVTRGSVVHYRIARNGQPHELTVRFDGPLASPTFAATFTASAVVGLTFLLIGAFVFWRRPLDSRATVFYAMTLVAAVTFANTSLIQIEGSNLRGIVSAEQSVSEVWHIVILGAASLFFAPLLLHLALIFPKERPILQRRPRTFFWVYGYPGGFWVYGGLLLGLLAAITARKGDEALSVKAILAVIVTMTVIALARLIVSITRRGLREGFLNAPLAVVTIALSLYSGILLLATRATTQSKSAVPLFVATFLLVMLGLTTFGSYPVATFIALYRSYRESGAEERRQVKWPIWATMVAVGGKIVLSIIGFVIVFLTTFRHASFPTLLYGLPDIASKVLYILIPLSFAFAILKYRLMNIDVIIRRTVLYSIFTAIVFVLYAVLVAGVGTALVKFVGLTSQAMLVASTVVVALAAVPIRNRLQRMVDRNLFRERRDYPLALRNIGNAIGASSGIDDFLRYVTEQIQQALQNRFVIIALRRDREYVAAAKIGVADEVLGNVRVPTDFDAMTIPEPLRRLGTALVLPVRSHRETVALLAFGSKLSDEDFSAEDHEFLGSAASQIAVGIENLRLRDEEVEFEQARAMQQILLPKRFPQLPGFEIAGVWLPARSVGGDYFDTLLLGDGKAGICIGDVAGKGMPAALLMANLQAAVKATAAAAVAPAVVCERVKEIVGGNLTGGKFISFFYGLLDSSARTFTYSNAGHNPPILVRTNSAVERLARGGPAMGRLFKNVPHQQDVARLDPGDRVVLFTDGVSEARRGEEEFGDDRLIELLIAHLHLGARELQARIIEELRQFTNGEFSDDVTLVVIAG